MFVTQEESGDHHPITRKSKKARVLGPWGERVIR